MGLDVYLYRYEDYARAKRIEKAQEKFDEKLYNEIPGNTDEAFEKRSAKKEEWAKKHELVKGKYGWDLPGESKIEIDSKKYPKHYFKVGYLRSSYNPGGINNILNNLLGEKADLYYIFQPEDQYEFQPDWLGAKSRTMEVLEKYRKAMARSGGVKIVKFMANMFIDPNELCSSEKQALDIFTRERERYEASKSEDKNKPFILGDYSNRDGEFFFNDTGLTVRAVIHGVEKDLLGRGKMPVVYVAVEQKVTKKADPDDETGGKDWYEAALEITIEMIDYVLAQKDPQKFYLHWSG